MGTELEIALVLLAAFLWVAVTMVILSGIDRRERKARRRARRAARHQNPHPRIRRLGLH